MQLGCNPESRNRRNKTCADLIADASVWETLISYVHVRRPSPSSAAKCETNSESAVIPIEVKDETAVESTTQLLPSNGAECIVCYENPPTVRFEPCGHVIACFECAQRMKKCLECHVVIVLKSNLGSYNESIPYDSLNFYTCFVLPFSKMAKQSPVHLLSRVEIA